MSVRPDSAICSILVPCAGLFVVLCRHPGQEMKRVIADGHLITNHDTGEAGDQYSRRGLVQAILILVWDGTPASLDLHHCNVSQDSTVDGSRALIYNVQSMHLPAVWLQPVLGIDVQKAKNKLLIELLQLTKDRLRFFGHRIADCMTTPLGFMNQLVSQHAQDVPGRGWTVPDVNDAGNGEQ